MHPTIGTHSKEPQGTECNAVRLESDRIALSWMLCGLTVVPLQVLSVQRLVSNTTNENHEDI